MAGGGVALIGITLDPAAVRPAGLMAPHNTRGRSRYTGPPAKEVIPVDL